MTRPALITNVICGFVLAAMAGLACGQTPGRGGARVASRVLNPEAEMMTAWLEQLSVEVKTIKSELHKLQIELQKGKIEQLDRELQQAQADRRLLEAQESSRNQDLAALDNHLAQSTLTAEERKEVEANRAELLASGLEPLRAELQAAAQREPEVNKRLEREQQRFRELVAKVKEESR